MYFIQFWQSYRYNYWPLNHSRLDVSMFSLLTGAPVSATRSLSLSLSSSGHLVFTAVHCLCHNSGALFQLIFNGRPWCWSMEQFVALSLQESSGCSPWPKGHCLLIPQRRNYHLQDREVIAPESAVWKGGFRVAHVELISIKQWFAKVGSLYEVSRQNWELFIGCECWRPHSILSYYHINN